MLTNPIQVLSETELLGHQFTVYGTAENPLFKAKEVAEFIEHPNVTVMLNLVDEEEKGVKQLLTPGGNQQVWFLTEDGLYEVLMQSRKPIAKQFKKGVKEILKSIRRTGEFSTRKQPTLKDQISWVKEVKKLLNLNDSSTLELLQNVAAPLGLPLPNYTPSKGILKSASELLKENGIPMSVQSFNTKLIEFGYLTEITRPSSNGGTKKFKSITAKGLEYGENQVNPNNPKSTQPLWYADKFNELVEIANNK